MKTNLRIRHTLFFFVLIVFFTFSGCHKKGQSSFSINNLMQGSHETTLSGNWMANETGYLYLTYQQHTDSVKCGKEGEFKFDFEIETPQYVQLYRESLKLRLYIEPANNLVVKLAGENVLSQLTFEGTGAEPNRYLIEKMRFLVSDDVPIEQLYALPQAQFQKNVDSVYVVQKMILDKFIEQHPNIDQQFVLTEQASLLYNRSTKLYEYPLMSANFSPNAEYFNFESSLPAPDSTMLSDFDVMAGLKAMIEYKASVTLNQTGRKEFYPYETAMSRLKTIQTEVSDSYLKNALFVHFIKQYISYYGYKHSDPLFEFYITHCQNTMQCKQLVEPYKYYLSLMNQATAPDILIEDQDGTTYNLADFKDKYLYIDIWATWCMPCQKALPLFSELETKWESAKLEFITLSIDDNRDEWLEFLQSKNFAGKHYRCLYPEKFIADYLVKTIPQYMLISPKSKIADLHAPAPYEAEKWLANSDYKK